MFLPGKLRTYLAYAVGEIFLIVVGILIALQISDWNEGKKDRQKEIKILTSLHQDFATNIDRLDAALLEYDEMDASNLIMMGYVGKPAEAFENIDPLSVIKTVYAITEIVDGTLSSVLSTEKLELIQDDVLKKMLTAYPASILSFKQREENLEKLVLEVQRPLIESHVSLLAELLPPDELQFDQVRSQAAKSDYHGLLNDVRWQNVLYGRYWYTDELREAAVELKEKSQQVFEQISQNLESLNALP